MWNWQGRSVTPGYENDIADIEYLDVDGNITDYAGAHVGTYSTGGGWLVDGTIAQRGEVYFDSSGVGDSNDPLEENIIVDSTLGAVPDQVHFMPSLESEWFVLKCTAGAGTFPEVKWFEIFNQDPDEDSVIRLYYSEEDALGAAIRRNTENIASVGNSAYAQDARLDIVENTIENERHQQEVIKARTGCDTYIETIILETVA